MKKIVLIVIIVLILTFVTVVSAEGIESYKYEKMYFGCELVFENGTFIYSNNMNDVVHVVQNMDNSYRYVLRGVKFLNEQQSLIEFSSFEERNERGSNYSSKFISYEELPNIPNETDSILFLVGLQSLDGGYIDDIGWIELDKAFIPVIEKTANNNSVKQKIETAIMIDVSDSMYENIDYKSIIDKYSNTNTKVFAFSDDYLEITNLDEQIQDLGGVTDLYGNIEEILNCYNPKTLVIISDLEDTYNKWILSDNIYDVESLDIYTYTLQLPKHLNYSRLESNFKNINIFLTPSIEKVTIVYPENAG